MALGVIWSPQIAPVLLTVYKDDERIFQAVCAGACGYLLKKTPPARLLEAVREIAEGGAVMSPEVAIRVVELFRRTQSPEQFSAGLTPQELRLLKLLAEGHQNKTAASEMAISIHTVGFHLRSIYEKLHVHSRSEAVARALYAELRQCDEARAGLIVVEAPPAEPVWAAISDRLARASSE